MKQFQEKYGPEVTKWDIFHYAYGLLHHPGYRELYKENLKRDLPHIPLLHEEGLEACMSVGQQLMELHLKYEETEEYPLKIASNKEIPYLQLLRVEKMRLSADKRTLVVSEGLTLEGIPEACFEYCLGNRSALPTGCATRCSSSVGERERFFQASSVSEMGRGALPTIM